MIIIHPAATVVERIIGKQKRGKKQCYRLLTYVIQQPLKDGLLLYNVLTRCMVFLTIDEANNIIQQDELFDLWFLVSEGHDDQKLCNQIRSIARLMKHVPKGISKYTILTTTDCNARCFYCYEKGCVIKTMDENTAHKVADYIIEHHQDKNLVKLSWFGGEPLYNSKVIDIICQKLQSLGHNFYSTMVSNAYLFDNKIISRAKDLWKLKRVQITLDGTQPVYNKVKTFIYKDVNPYAKVIGNISKLLNADINVNILLNLDRHNADNLLELVEELGGKFSGYENFYIFPPHLLHEFGPTGKKRDDTHRQYLYYKQSQIEQRLAELGMDCYRHRLLPDDIMLSHCMVDSGDAIMILPDGHIGLCEHHLDNHYIGHIDSKIIDHKALQQSKEYHKDLLECASCPLYPDCYRLIICGKYETCYLEQREKGIYEMRRRMENEYNYFKTGILCKSFTRQIRL